MWRVRNWFSIIGSRQEGGAPIDDVELPPWAYKDSRLFVELHREALESDYVSDNIHQWIDLSSVILTPMWCFMCLIFCFVAVFGYRQKGQAAIESLNVFQEVSYEGTVSLGDYSYMSFHWTFSAHNLVMLDAIHDEDERSSVVGAMCNWGTISSHCFWVWAHIDSLNLLSRPDSKPDLFFTASAAWKASQASLWRQIGYHSIHLLCLG